MVYDLLEWMFDCTMNQNLAIIFVIMVAFSLVFSSVHFADAVSAKKSPTHNYGSKTKSKICGNGICGKTHPFSASTAQQESVQ